MGVYIKDIAKPENCDVCPIRLVYLTCGCDREHCMIQEVPEPHGRLIDGDKLKEYWQPDHNRYFDADHFIHTIEVAKTVIPRSEVET